MLFRSDIDQIPKDIVRRLVHYFTTYKDIPGDLRKRMEFVGLYGAEEAKEVIRAAMKDYENFKKTME